MSVGKDHCSAQYNAKELMDFLNELNPNFQSQYFLKIFSIIMKKKFGEAHFRQAIYLSCRFLLTRI